MPKKLADVVRLHSGLAVGAAFIPIPVADVTAAAANIWTMYVRINRELELPFGENIIKSLAAGAVTNLGSAVVGMVVIGSIVKFFPGIGSFAGAAILGATVYAITNVAGIIYMKAITNLVQRKKIHEIDESDLKNATQEEMDNKENMKNMIKEAKYSYKKSEQ